jgi:hypothetical protein
MRKGRVAIILLTCGLWAAAGVAQGKTLAGHWEADMSEEGRTFTFVFEFKPAGDTFTGSVGLDTLDQSFPITNGKITGDHVSFKGFGIWTGTLRGDELALTRELDGGKKQRMTARRFPAK